MAQQRHLLFYEYVADIVERREPFRADHLSAIRTAKEDGRILQAGPLGDPPHGAAIVFADPATAEEFAQADPYVVNGLVTSWRVEPWTLV
ncbi:MAG TPA: YciI family protein [Solirubrobacteraceae bacterium]|nr:YciI family protein [Solirubrobacteraceae bacterium]